MNSSAASDLKQLLCVPPPNFAGNPNSAPAVAHAALQALRDSGDERFLFLRTIIELRGDVHKNEELLFHCLTGLRQVVLHRWTAVAKGFREVVRDFLLAIGQENYPRTIKLACYTAAASFWKRQWNDLDTTPSTQLGPAEQAMVDAMTQAQPVRLNSKQDLLLYLESLLQTNSPNMASGAQFLSVLVGEFMGKSAVQYHLPLEFHKKAHSSFEADGWLDHSLQLSMGALSHVVSQISTAQNSEALPVVQLTIDVISWEFGTEAWDVGIPITSSKTLVRCPVSWRDFIIRPDFCGAVFHVHEAVVRSQPKLAHAFRQLLLLLTSLSGAIFVDEDQRKSFATHLLDGSLRLLSLATSTETRETSELLDSLAIVSRLIANFKLSVLVKLPSLTALLAAITTTGTTLLQANVHECESVQGDVESMEHREWREEALALILEGCVLLSSDPWLLYSGSEESRKAAQSALASTLAPLYSAFLSCRVKMARLEEFYLTANAAELDEVREEISAVDLDEEMASVASLGRLSLSTSLDCISALFQPVLQNLQALWEMSHVTDVNPECAALLEETRLLTMSLGHLLTDDNAGETPVIPESIIIACQGGINTTNGIASSVQAIMTLAQVQAGKIAINAHDTTLSPLLATSFLWFLNRWAPAYILPIDYGSTNGAPSQIQSVWGPGDRANQAISFCATLCLHYQCFWPQEKQVQENASKLLLQLSKRGEKMRAILVGSPSFQQMATFHCLTAGLRHSAPAADLNAVVEANGSTASIQMARGYQRLPYDDRSQILTALLVATCEMDDSSPVATAMFNQCLGSVHSAFKQLVDALANKRIAASDLDAKEMASLCVEMHGGVARSSDMTEPERVMLFLTPALQDLSSLMNFYAEDLCICESLLKLFRDYTEYFVALLNKEQSLALFRASADLLRSYSAAHCATRVVTRLTASSTEAAVEEEQNYSDVLCAIQLLIHLGTKDFLDICSATNDGIESGQVTDIIFFGLQQIIPLMTQGLLQFPSLCTQYFSLVGFMMDTYPDKVCILPYELFNSLLESLLFGMSHVDCFVSKSSLQGIAGIVKEHLQSQALSGHLSNHPGIFDECTRRLLQEVVFQSIVWDRLEASGLALLPLAAVDVNRFVAVVNGLAHQVPGEQQARLHASFENLVQPEVLAKVTSGGYDGRMNRIKFKKNFELFVKDIHSFLVIK